jgi:hypothetical protein
MILGCNVLDFGFRGVGCRQQGSGFNFEGVVVCSVKGVVCSV